MIFHFSSINLWCNKNLVDTQYLLGKIFTLTEKQVKIQPRYFSDPFEPKVEFVFLNSCGFISSARDETKETISKLLENWKKVYLLGCALQYYKNLKKSESNVLNHPNVFCISRDDFTKITLEKLIKWYRSQNFGDFEFVDNPRIYTNIDNNFEYLKIAEWCDNRCSFCIIPQIRWKQKSLEIQKVLDEVQNMYQNWADEIILIAQDTSRYGTDLYGKPALFELLEKIDNLEWDFRFRLLYMYPDILSLDWLQKLKQLQKFIPYFDIPIQHISPNLLKRMWRFYDEKLIHQLLEFIKTNFPVHYIRTNIIIWFPWETDADHKKLIWFLNKEYFDNIAIFEYHDEPLASSSKLDKKVNEKTIRTRFLEAERLVNQLLDKKLKNRKGKEEVWYIMWIEKNNILIVKPLLHAPEIDPYDEISLDQITWVENNKLELEIGDKISYFI